MATFYQDANYGGYAVELPVGTYTQADMAVYGIRARDVSSFKVADGYEVTLCAGENYVRGVKNTWTESTSYVGSDWNDRAKSIKVAPIGESGVKNVVDADCREMKVAKASGSDSFLVSGADGRNIELYNNAGMKVAEVACSPAGETVVDMSGMADGLYIFKSGARSAKFIKN